MTDGGLITADYQFELDNVLYGAGQEWDNAPEGWVGLLDMVVRDQDEANELVDGDADGTDTNAALLIGGNLQWMGESRAGPALTSARLLGQQWKASSQLRKLWFRLPDMGLCYVEGKRRGAHLDLANVSVGDVGALVSFKALRPEIVTVAP